jgi:hypothetical protein
VVFTQPPHAIRMFYIIASPAQLWRAGTRAFKFEAGPEEVKALTRGLGRLCGWHRFRALGGQCCVRSAVIWACRKVVRGAIWARRPSVVLLKLLARRWLDCFGAVPAGRQFYRCDRPKVVQWFVPFAKNGLPLGFRSRSMCAMRDPPDSFTFSYKQSTLNFLHPLPGETVAALTRHHSHPCSARVRAGDRQLPQYLWGRRRPPRYAPLHRFGQPGVDQSKTPVRLCGTQPRATRANRAQSTAHH